MFNAREARRPSATKALRALCLMTRYAPAVVTRHQVAVQAAETTSKGSLDLSRPCDSIEKLSAPEGQTPGPESAADRTMQAKKPVARQAARTAMSLSMRDLRWEYAERAGVGQEGTRSRQLSSVVGYGSEDTRSSGTTASRLPGEELAYARDAQLLTDLAQCQEETCGFLCADFSMELSPFRSA